MAQLHEVRDPIHAFVRFDSQEREIINSPPMQRLRHIHQLALTHYIYPGATHTRLEHVLGVMELAGRVFDIVTDHRNLTDELKEELKQLSDPDQLAYWRRALRMAALLHDVGHLPFSHAAEKELLPKGWSHERMTREIVLSDLLAGPLQAMRPPIVPMDVVKLSVGPEKATDLEFSVWEAILSEIITGDAFGVDRMDYLLRDSHHTGVAYGKFDHYRLIDTLRILPSPETKAPTLGIEEGGLQSAEALLWARYQIYSQVYFHPVRRIYDIHLREFLGEWLPGGRFSTDVGQHMLTTDNEVMSAIAAAARDRSKPGHFIARRIWDRNHFRLIYQGSPDDAAVNPEPGALVFKAVEAEFGEGVARHDRVPGKGGAFDFPVKKRSGEIASSLVESQVLKKMPVVAADSVYIKRAMRERAKRWLEQNKRSVVTPPEEEGHEQA